MHFLPYLPHVIEATFHRFIRPIFFHFLCFSLIPFFSFCPPDSRKSAFFIIKKFSSPGIAPVLIFSLHCLLYLMRLFRTSLFPSAAHPSFPTTFVLCTPPGSQDFPKFCPPLTPFAQQSYVRLLFLSPHTTYTIFLPTYLRGCCL